MKRNKLFTALFILIAVFLLVYGGYQAYKAFYKPYQTEIATSYSVNDSVHISGLAVRTETLIENEYGGSVSYVFEDASKINKNKPVAYTHASSDTVNKMSRAESLAQEISMLQDASVGVTQLYGSSEYINTQIGNNILDYTGIALSGNMADYESTRNSLLLSINKKRTITGEESRFQERIDNLQEEYDDLLEEIGSDEAETVLAPKNGYFISTIDGFENLINKDTLYEMTVADIENLIGTDSVVIDPKVGKIADSYKWLYVFAVDTETSEKFSEGLRLKVKFDGINKQYDFTVKSLISDDTSTDVIIVLECKEFSSEVSSLRQVSADIIFEKIEGLRISVDSIRFDEDQNVGVYILEKNTVKFRSINILYTGQGFCVVEWDKNDSKSLQLYDEVFLSGNDIYLGKIID